MKKHVRGVKGDARGEGDDWMGVMGEMGLKREWREMLWESNWSKGRWYQRKSSLKEEVLWMVEERWEELAGLGDKIWGKYVEGREKKQKGEFGEFS